MSGFTSRDRRSYAFTRERQHGGAVDLATPVVGRVGVGFLTRTGINQGDVWSGRGDAALVRGAALDWEYGHGTSATGAGDAYTVTLRGNVPRLSYALRREAADTGFPGYWRGSSSTDASLTLRPFRDLGLIGNFSDLVARPRQSALGSRDARQQTIENGVAWGDIAGATYRWSRQAGLIFGVVPTRRHGSSVRVFLGAPFARRFSLRAEVEQGYSAADEVPDDRTPFRQLGLRGSMRSNRLSLNASVEQLTGARLSAFAPQDQTSASLNASVRIRAGTQLNLGMNATRYTGAQARTFSLVDLGVGQALPFGQRVTWRGRSYGASSATPSPLGRQTMQQVEYMFPVGVPVGASGESGVIEARLVDAATGAPVAGVLMRLAGEARITDAQGRAEFTRLGADTYYLEVDRAKLTRGQIVMPGTPVVVTLGDGEHRSLDLRVEGSAAIRGTARLLRRQPTRLGAPDTLVDAGPLANVALSIGNSGDTVRTLTDAEGRFSVREMHAGHWVLRVVQADLPARHQLEPERVELELVPGEVRDIALRAIPAKSEVRFVDEADLTPRAAPAPPTPKPEPVLPTPRRRRPSIRRTVPAPEAEQVLPPPAAAPAPVRHWYTVGRGDARLSAVARVMYGDVRLWPKIWLANRDLLRTPDDVRPGMRLRIPDKAPLTAEEMAARDAWGGRAREE